MTRSRWRPSFKQPGEYPILDLVLDGKGMPLNLAADVTHIVGTAFERAGYRVFFRQETGLGRIWVSRDPDPDPDPDR